MSRRAAAFTQADIHRALKAALQAQPGVRFEVVIGGGVARIVPVNDAPQPPREPDPSASPAAALPPPLDSKPKWIL